MAYSKKNMIKTLEVAKEYLKSGYIQGEWICKKPGNEGFECCAEGSVLLACGINVSGTWPTIHDETKNGKYAIAIINKLDDTVANRSEKFNSIMDVNDGSGLKTTLGWFDKTIQELQKGN